MPAFTIKQLSCDLTPVAGLSLVGHHLSRLAPVLGRIDAALPVRTGVATSDIVRAYVGLLVQGKSDFDAIENYRGDTFYKQSLGISLLASSATLRQRMDAAAAPLLEHAPALIETLLAQARPEFGTLACGWLPLDIDAFVMDNSDTAKQGVGRTYTGVDGYCPLAAYLGTKGYCLALQLREGQQHSARGTPCAGAGALPAQAPASPRSWRGPDIAGMLSRRSRGARARTPARHRRADAIFRTRGTTNPASFARTMIDARTSKHDCHRNRRARCDERARHYACSGITCCRSAPQRPAGSPAPASAAHTAARNRPGIASPTSAPPAVAKCTDHPAMRTTGAR